MVMCAQPSEHASVLAFREPESYECLHYYYIQSTQITFVFARKAVGDA